MRVQLRINGLKVQVTGLSDEVLPEVLGSVMFNEWRHRLGPGFVVKSIEFQSVDMFGSKPGFIKFKADVVGPDGKFIPGIVFMRGGCVAILPILECEGVEYTIVIHQRRFASGYYDLVEIPAGMLDGDGNFAGVAAKEMDEETGIKMGQDELVDMTEMVYGDSVPGVFTTPGGSDEFIRYFLYREQVDRHRLAELQGKLTGAADENEQIILEVIPLADLWRRAPESKAHTALSLYNGLKSEGRI